MEIKNCVLVTLNIRHWDANSLDRSVSQAVAQQKGVKDQTMCRLRKSLLPKSAAASCLAATSRAARTFHYENTHSYVHEGPRILTRANYEPYMQQMLRFKSEYQTNVLEFCAQYDEIKATAQNALGELYRVEDYPTKDDLLERYGFEIAVLPMPSASSLLDFGLDDQETASLKARLETELSDTFGRANQKMWDDLYVRLEKLSTKLNDEGAHVMEETIAAAQKLSGLVPRINLTDDTRLDAIAQKMSATLDGVTSVGVKVNPVLRERVAKETRELVATMKLMMKPEAASSKLPEASRMAVAA